MHLLKKLSLRRASANDLLLRQWIVLCVAQIWAENDDLTDLAVSIDPPQFLMGQLGEDQAPDLHNASLSAISTFLGTSGSVDVNKRCGAVRAACPAYR